MSTNELGPIPTVRKSLVVTEEQASDAFGHVTYLGQLGIFFDEMIRIMNEKGLGFGYLRSQEIAVSVDSQDSHHLRELKAGDEVEIVTNIQDLEQQIKFKHEMFRFKKPLADQTLFINLRTKGGRPMDVPLWVSEELRKEINE